MVSSLRSWYCRLSAKPAFTCSVLPQKLPSTRPKISSCPQGFSTLRTGETQRARASAAVVGSPITR